MTKTKEIKVSYEYSGLLDYWGGNGRRWDNNAGCLFTFYGPDTTTWECVEQWIEDFNTGGDCDSFPEEISGEDIRNAILECFTEQGKEDYYMGNLCEPTRNSQWDEYDPDMEEMPMYVILVEVL
tara:strand:- start:267 stop:638 length:372 start_codon:yes stop_codon:yes gene_type:complete